MALARYSVAQWPYMGLEMCHREGFSESVVHRLGFANLETLQILVIRAFICYNGVCLSSVISWYRFARVSSAIQTSCPVAGK